MGVLDVFRSKKKKNTDDDLPTPPPVIEEHHTRIPSDIEPIQSHKNDTPPPPTSPKTKGKTVLPPLEPMSLDEETFSKHEDDFGMPDTKEEDIPMASDFPPLPKISSRKEKIPPSKPTSITPSRTPPVSPSAKHIFISSEEYSSIIEKTNKIRSTLLESDEYLQKLADLQGEEEAQLGEWQEQLEAVEKKIERVETILAQQSEA